jgi:integrase
MIRRRGAAWTVSVDLGRTGRKRQRVWRTARTQREAVSIQAQLVAERDTGIAVQPGRITFGQFFDRWLDAYARQQLGAKTVLRYEQLARLHLIPTLGAIPLKALKPLQIQTAYGKITASGRSAQTALHAHRLLHGALAHAVKWQLISRNPADAVNAPRPEKREMVMLEAESLQRLIEAADRTPLGAMVHTALMSGLRFGELAGLRWGDVDLENRELHVRQVAQWLPRTGFIYKQPKTAGSARTVALPASTVERLRRHHTLQLETRLMVGPEYSDNNLVFASITGGPIDPSNLRRTWTRLIADAGVKLTFHGLRHCHASLLLQQGTHIKVVSERLGHSNTQITLDTYSHLLPGMDREAADRLDKTLTRTG